MVLSSKAISYIIVITIGILYTGLFTPIIFGARFIDLFIGLVFILTLLKRLSIPKQSIPFILFTAVATLSGLFNGTEYFASDLRYFLVLSFSIFLAVYLGNQISIRDCYLLFIYLIGFYVLVYMLLFLFPTLQTFYQSNVFVQGDEQRLLTITGPSLSLLFYLYIPIVFYKAKFLRTTFLFICSLLLYYTFINSSRQYISIAFLLVLLNVLYTYKIKIFSLKFVIFTLLICSLLLIISLYGDSRTLNIFSPQKDTSFMYRVISVIDLWHQLSGNTKNLVFGLGAGSTVYLDLGDYLGIRKANLIDNTILTIIMKAGVLGLFIFGYGLLKPALKLERFFIVLLFVPIIIAGLISSHVIYNIQHIFGFFLCLTILNRQLNNENSLYNN
ncbi:hypothetical protein [Draconibacterium sediminis]|uniref:hypothetical protein n=1 Tax=Draconibacterium sediminis TaxID=1544798 RepID=UPI0026EBC274|nr:hypothetical protein [Draconibacterium sediminis]